jgi:plastocyanin
MNRHHTGNRRLSFVLTTGLFALTALNAAATSAQGIAIQLGDYRFTPDSITAKSGETLHNFTLKAEAAGLDVDIDVSAGETEVVDITPRASGTYRFYCDKKLPFMKSHRDRGMEGTLVVTPGSAD